MESDVVTMQDIFEFKLEQITADRVVIGSLQPTGLRPTFLDKFEKRGVELPNSLFAVARSNGDLGSMVAR
jgi:pilus assembly protein CpaF